MIPLGERVLLQVHWVDATNVAGGWFGAEDLAEWAANGAWECSNTGWLIYEDDACYVLAGRMTDDGEHVGLIERIPKTAVTLKTVLAGPGSAAAHRHDAFRCPAHVQGCSCADPENSRCNPYRVAGHCPDDLQVIPGATPVPPGAASAVP